MVGAKFTLFEWLDDRDHYPHKERKEKRRLWYGQLKSEFGLAFLER